MNAPFHSQDNESETVTMAVALDDNDAPAGGHGLFFPSSIRRMAIFQDLNQIYANVVASELVTQFLTRFAPGLFLAGSAWLAVTYLRQISCVDLYVSFRDSLISWNNDDFFAFFLDPK